MKFKERSIAPRRDMPTVATYKHVFVDQIQ